MDCGFSAIFLEEEEAYWSKVMATCRRANGSMKYMENFDKRPTLKSIRRKVKSKIPFAPLLHLAGKSGKQI